MGVIAPFGGDGRGRFRGSGMVRYTVCCARFIVRGRSEESGRNIVLRRWKVSVSELEAFETVI